MRKWLAVVLTLGVLLSAAACTSPFEPETETEPPSAERTFVITEQTHEGLAKMADSVTWQNNALCVVQYIGERSNYADALKSVYKTYFSDVDAASFDAMQRIDVGGSEVYLVVPRFDLEKFSIFSIAIDSEGKTHILKQAGETSTAFLLLCNTKTDPDAAIALTLTGDDKEQKMRIVMRRDDETGALSLPAGIQGLENK